MSRFIAITVNQNDRIDCALKPFAQQVAIPGMGAGGWGLGYYHSGEALRRMEPRDEGEPLNTFELVSELKADLLLLHAREATVGRVRRENTHPFKFQHWMFAHNGTIAGFERFKAKAKAAMPPFILRGIAGDTDSEHLFHLFLSFLYDSGQVNRPNLGATAIVGALCRAISTFDEFAREEGEAPSPISVAVSDGYSMVVAARGVPVAYALVEGVRDCEVCRPSIMPGEEATAVDHGDLKAAVVLSGKSLETSTGFQRLEDNQVLTVSMAHGVEFRKLNLD